MGLCGSMEEFMWGYTGLHRGLCRPCRGLHGLQRREYKTHKCGKMTILMFEKSQRGFT